MPRMPAWAGAATFVFVPHPVGGAWQDGGQRTGRSLPAARPCLPAPPPRPTRPSRSNSLLGIFVFSRPVLSLGTAPPTTPSLTHTLCALAPASLRPPLHCAASSPNQLARPLRLPPDAKLHACAVPFAPARRLPRLVPPESSRRHGLCPSTAATPASLQPASSLVPVPRVPRRHNYRAPACRQELGKSMAVGGGAKREQSGDLRFTAGLLVQHVGRVGLAC